MPKAITELQQYNLAEAIDKISDFTFNVYAASTPETNALAELTHQLLEWFAEAKPDVEYIRPTSPKVYAALLSEFLKPSMNEWDLPTKRFLIEVAEHLGPENVRLLRSVAAFMQRAEEFKIDSEAWGELKK